MIQPSFTFLVGVALPFSMASRIKKGGTKKSILTHAIKRSLILIFLGVFLRSIGAKQTYFTFEDTLSQIGLGYTFLVILGFYSQRVQIWALAIILFGYWLAFVLYPLPKAGFDYTTVGQPVNWRYNAEGIAAHWNLNANLGFAFDRWFLNLWPREGPFLFHKGGYYTLNFIPTLGTMILGLLAGNALRSDSPGKKKLHFFVIMGMALVAFGVILHVAGVVPVVKRIWTPSWTVWSGGICFLMLAIFYGIIDLAGCRKWSFFLIVIGANSIAAYVMADSGMRGFISSTLHTHLGQNFDQVFGKVYSPLLNGFAVLFIMWLILFWMYKKRIFIKI
jgi:predicted acyltransferase